jgi:hypothetical protein
LAVEPHAQEGIFIYFISRRYYTKEGDSCTGRCSHYRLEGGHWMITGLSAPSSTFGGKAGDL